MKLTSVEGEIASFEADVLVNSTNKELDLGLGRISKSVLTTAGPQLQVECFKRFPRGLNFREIAVTSGYGLKCKNVYHVAIPPWGTPDIDAQEALCQTVCKCLQEAHQHNMASIAFPALGCGFLNYPMEVVTDTIHECVEKFKTATGPSSLKEVFLVIEPKGEDWQHIKEAFRKSKAKPSDVRRSVTSTDNLRSFMCAREVARNSCKKTLPCGHKCMGYTNEPVCPPCLEERCHTGCLPKKDEDCSICFTDPLSAAPIVKLDCGHVFHLHCAKRFVKNRWVGNRINLNFMHCTLCKKPLDHPEFENYLGPYRSLYDDVQKKALARLQYEKLDKCEAVTRETSPYFGKPDVFAMERYAYYRCFKCKQAYFGGAAECGELVEDVDVPPRELICPNCDETRLEKCSKHGDDFIEYKCRYCCSLATYFCFGTTHMCDTCHSVYMRIRHAFPVPCPAGPGRKRLTGPCPLGFKHPPTGQEFCIGCRLCPADAVICGRAENIIETSRR